MHVGGAALAGVEQQPDCLLQAAACVPCSCLFGDCRPVLSVALAALHTLITLPAHLAVARKVRAGQEALAAGEADRALLLAEAACEGSVPAAEPAVRLRVEALLHLGR